MVSHGLVTIVTTHQNPNSDLVPRYRYPGTMLPSYSYTHSLSSATWHLGPVPIPVPIPVPMVPIPMVPYPYPYPYLWSRTHTRTRTHDFVTCRTRTHTRTHGLVPVPVPIPIVSNPYPYPYPWPRTHTRTRTHDPYPHYKSDYLYHLRRCTCVTEPWHTVLKFHELWNEVRRLKMLFTGSVQMYRKWFVFLQQSKISHFSFCNPTTSVLVIFCESVSVIRKP